MKAKKKITLDDRHALKKTKGLQDEERKEEERERERRKRREKKKEAIGDTKRRGQNYSEMKEDRKKRSLQYNKRDITGLWLIWSRKFKRLKAF